MKKILYSAVACLMLVLLPVGCTQQQVSTVVNEIATELPTALQLALQISTIVAAFGSPGQAVVIPTDQIKADIQELQTLVASYQASPSSTVYGRIVAVVNDLVTKGQDQLLAAARIIDPKSREEATAIIGSLNAVLIIIDGYVNATQTDAQLKAKASTRKMKLSEYKSSLNYNILNKAAGDNHTTVAAFMSHEQALGF